MKIVIDIPDIIKNDYIDDKFYDFFNRVIADIKDGYVCGNYEIETAKELLKSFQNSKLYDKKGGLE